MGLSQYVFSLYFLQYIFLIWHLCPSLMSSIISSTKHFYYFTLPSLNLNFKFSFNPNLTFCRYKSVGKNPQWDSVFQIVFLQALAALNLITQNTELKTELNSTIYCCITIAVSLFQELKLGSDKITKLDSECGEAGRLHFHSLTRLYK